MAKFSRRDFLKGAALAAGAGAVAGLAGCSAPASSAGESGGSSADEISWDEEYDVVVVGAGLAGSSAAVALALEGNGETCLLLEKDPESDAWLLHGAREYPLLVLGERCSSRCRNPVSAGNSSWFTSAKIHVATVFFFFASLLIECTKLRLLWT